MRQIKIFFVLLISLLPFSCNSGVSNSRFKEWMGQNDKLKVLSTTAQVGDLVTFVGGDRVDGWVLIQGDLDPHSYEMVKGDGEKFERAALVFYNGLGLEHGGSLSNFLKTSSKTVGIGEKIKEACPDRILMKKEAIDPHIWMDVSLWQKGIDPIVEALGQKDPEGISYYRERGEVLKGQMEKAHGEIRKLVMQVSGEKRYLVTSHDAFHYFTRAYLADEGEENWVDRFAAPEGLAPDGQLNPLDLQKILDFLSEKKIAVLFPESNVSPDSIRKIASAGRELGVEVLVCREPLYGDSMSGLSYLEMMHRNAAIISRYLGGQE